MEKQKAFHIQNTEELLKEFQTSRQGLSTEEAEKRLIDYGKNQLEEEQKKTLMQKFFAQFKDFMILVLITAAIVSGILGDLPDAIIIFIVVLLNAVIGVVQENKAEEAIAALKEMSAPETHVRRNGEVKTIVSSHLVPGDIVLLEAGDVVPADMRLIEMNALKIEEAALTGESVPVEKEANVLKEAETDIGDRVNMAFMNTNVTYGRAEGIVVGTGMKTEVGKIADMLTLSEQVTTPLQKDLNRLGKYLTIAILIVAVMIFGVGMLQGRAWLEMLLVSISLAVAAIPEGLPAIVTIILSLGTQRMANRKAIVRHLPAVEALGSTDVICSDKTGTLTKNEMTVEKFYTEGQMYEADNDIQEEHPFIQSIVFANDTEITKQGEELLGDPTETALIQFALDKGVQVQDKRKNQPRIDEIPFDSDRKLMTTVRKTKSGKYFVATKGAPDILLEHCSFIYLKGDIYPLDDQKKKEILEANHEMATHALRVLAGGFKLVDTLPSEGEKSALEQDLVFSGLVGMIDPEREEVKQAVDAAVGAGITTVMITGDHKDTAKAIAKRLGILDEGKEVMTGTELENLTQEELEKQVRNIGVYARVSPEHKVRIVKAWQKQGKIVAMTGDGVNDAPALKNADIGIGMGITGTEVSKNAADVVLSDDNFQTIVFAVEEGRKIFSNIQKAIQFLLSANLGEVFTLFIATLLGWAILGPVHILWINLVTDTLPAIALGLEPAETNIMQQAPRGKKSSFFSNGVLQSILYQGLLEGVITLSVYWLAIEFPMNPGSAEVIQSEALTMAFITLGMLQLFHAFNVKSIKQSLFKVGVFKNRVFNVAIVVSLILLLGVVLIPGIREWFDVVPLTIQQWGLALGASFSIIPIVETMKYFWRKTSR